jgi:DNA-binding response OmpR family regulator
MPILSDCGLGCSGQATTKPTLLAVSSSAADVLLLQSILSYHRWQFETVPTCQDAVSTVRRLRPRVVLCEETLSDGNWRNLLQALDIEGRGTRLIVASRRADDALWAEVLNLGGWDVLMEPFDLDEVQRVIESCHPEQTPAGDRTARVKLLETSATGFTDRRQLEFPAGDN